ncbi:hypothetical protein B0H11DRAFT_1969761 [Mycena galericulata]|nr:hypothetical protein B0H11DRAFT_1969761 [Mycena galericulata]
MKPWETDHTIHVSIPLDENCEPSPDMEDEVEMILDGGELDFDSVMNQQKVFQIEDDSKFHGSSKLANFDETLKEFSFEGSFLQSERYSMAQALNPCLDIDGTGLIGLPLSTHDAQALLSDSRPPESGVNRLEIPGNKVCFTSPEWDAWLQKKAELVCTALSGKRVKPLYKLTKLVIEGPDSQLEETPSHEAIATLIVVLPSLFEGGDMLFDHGVQSKTIRLAPESHIFTSLVVAYSVVKRRLCPITSGYRLALHYEVNQPESSDTAIPPFPNLDGAALALRQAMVEWNDGNTAEFQACYLKGKYPWDGFNLQLLTGQDALLMAHLVHYAAELDFQLYIVQAREFCVGIGEYDGPFDKINGKEIDFFEKASGWDARDEQAFDMNSIPISIGGFSAGSNSRLKEGLENVEPDEIYEDLEYGKVRIDQTFQRTLFLICRPSNTSDNPLSVAYSQKYAFHALSKSISISHPPSSAREKILVESLLANCTTEDKKKDATRGLARVAEAQNDVQLLLRTLEKHRVASNLDLIGVDACVSAYQMFGWKPLKSFFEDAIIKDVSNPRRQMLLTRLSEAAREKLDPEVEVWCEERQKLVLKSLSRASIAEVDWLLELATIHGANFMRTIVYPQLKSQQLESEFWVHFVRQLEKHAAAEDLGQSFVRECIEQAANNLLVFPPNERAGDSWSYDSSEPKTKAGLIIEVFRRCIEAGATASCAGIFERIKRADRERTLSSAFPAWECYAELSRWLHQHLAALPDPEPTAVVFQPFFGDAVACMLSASAETISGGKTFRACAFEEENLSIIVIAIQCAGGLSFLEKCDKKVVMAGRDSESLKILIRYLIPELQPTVDDIPATANYTAAINSVVRHTIDVFDTKAVQGPEGPMGRSSRSTNEIVDMFKFCSEVGARSEWQHLLAHLESPPLGVKLGVHVSRVLAPFMPALRDYLASQNLDLETEPFKMFASTVLKEFGSSVMNLKPRDLLADAQIACTRGIAGNRGYVCQECDSLKTFFTSDNQFVSLKGLRVPAREHLLERLATPKSWGVVAKVRGKNTLDITKPDSMTAAGLKAENQERGRALLAVLGDQAAQRRILGSEYKGVLAQISGKEDTGTKRKAGDDVEVPRTKKGRSS